MILSVQLMRAKESIGTTANESDQLSRILGFSNGKWILSSVKLDLV